MLRPVISAENRCQASPLVKNTKAATAESNIIRRLESLPGTPLPHVLRNSFLTMLQIIFQHISPETNTEHPDLLFPYQENPLIQQPVDLSNIFVVDKTSWLQSCKAGIFPKANILCSTNA